MVVLPGQNRLRTNCVELVTAIRKLINAYTCAFRVNFTLPSRLDPIRVEESSDVLDCVGFRVCALHRLESTWNFDAYEVRIELLHGVTSVGRRQIVFGTSSSRSAVFFPNRIVFDEVISFSSVAICTLPRESRLVLTVYGRRKVNDSDSGSGPEAEHIELGWTSQNFFRYGNPNWTLVQGMMHSSHFLKKYVVAGRKYIFPKLLLQVADFCLCGHQLRTSVQATFRLRDATLEVI